MFSKLRRPFGVAAPIAVLALVVAVAFAGVPAVAQPIATSSTNIFGKLKRSLHLGAAANKRAVIANKRSINAIKFARGIQNEKGPQGPRGPKGDKGERGDRGQQGVPGEDGASVTEQSLPPGDSNCPYGGASFSVAGGTRSYACSGAPTNIYWAVVEADGSINRSSSPGITSEAYSSTYEGLYEVEFPINVNKCAYTASIMDDTGSGRHGFITTSTSFLEGVHGVFVRITKATEPEVNIDEKFSLVVTC